MKKIEHRNGKKICSKCGHWKALDQFHRNAKRWDGVHSHCKSCMAENHQRMYSLNKPEMLKRQKAWRKANPRQRKNTLLKKRHGVTIDWYEQTLAKQGGVCAICKGRGKSALHVDHCHHGGGVRGLLCYRCNVAIGMLRDNPSYALAAHEYLKRHNSK